MPSDIRVYDFLFELVPAIVEDLNDKEMPEAEVVDIMKSLVLPDDYVNGSIMRCLVPYDECEIRAIGSYGSENQGIDRYTSETIIRSFKKIADKWKREEQLTTDHKDIDSPLGDPIIYLHIWW